jgi:hypothetical protein
MLGWIELTAPRELLCLRAEVVDDYSTPVQGPSAPLLWYRIIAIAISTVPNTTNRTALEPSETLGTRGCWGAWTSPSVQWEVGRTRRYIYLFIPPFAPPVLRIELSLPSSPLPLEYIAWLCVFLCVGTDARSLSANLGTTIEFVWLPMRCNPTSAVTALTSACHWIRAGKILDHQNLDQRYGSWVGADSVRFMS